MIKDTPNIVVKLDIAQPGKYQEFDHPTKVSQAHLQNFLESFTVRSSATLLAGILGEGETGSPPAFSSQFLDALVPSLIEGLERATPLEEVVFYFQDSSNPPLQYITSGSLFNQGKNLHLLIAHYKYTTAKPHDIRRIREEPRLALAEPYHEIIPGTNTTLAKTSQIMNGLLSLKPQHFIIERQLLGSIPPTNTTLPKKASPIAEFLHEQTPEERLRQIDALHEKGLISTKEYQNKRQDILDSL